jgi:hypothetical protein
VHVHAHDDRAARLGQARVQAGGDDALRVVDHAQARIPRRARIQPRARAVVALAVGDEQLQLPARGQTLRKRRVAQSVYVRALVAAGHDDAHAARHTGHCELWQHGRGRVPPGHGRDDGHRDGRRSARA